MTARIDVPGLDGSVREQIYDHVFQNADREVGGVLVGFSALHAGPPYVTAAVPAMAANEQWATLTFTADTWQHVHRVLDTEHPDSQIVGWYHSHPGFGIFLSSHDLFIHHNFFSGPSQIALVVDPLEGTEGVFGWTRGSLEKWYEQATSRPGLRRSAGHRVSEADHAVAPARPAAPEARGGWPTHRAAGKAPAAALLVALLVGVVLGLVLWVAVSPGDDRAPQRSTTTRSTGPQVTPSKPRTSP